MQFARPTFSYGTARTLFEGEFLGGLGGVDVASTLFRDYDISGDGQRFVMFPRLDQGAEGTVTLVTNFFEELKRLVPTDP